MRYAFSLTVDGEAAQTVRAELVRAFSGIAGPGEGWNPLRVELRQVSLIAYPEDLSGSPKIETLYSGPVGSVWGLTPHPI